MAITLTDRVLYNTWAIPHCTLGTVRPVPVASCVHNSTQQTVFGNCVTDRHTPAAYERLSNDRRSAFRNATSRYYVIQLGNSMEEMQDNSLKLQGLVKSV